MSDGPHRSLPMRPKWKRVAEWADRRVRSAQEVAEALAVAIREDCAKELPSELIRGFRVLAGDEQGQLFPPLAVDLQQFRHQSAGYALAGEVLNATESAAMCGTSGESVMVEGLADALLGRALSCVRQIDEHYIRKASGPHSAFVRGRLMEAINLTPFYQIARSILGIDGVSMRRNITKHTGLDDGVPLL